MICAAEPSIAAFALRPLHRPITARALRFARPLRAAFGTANIMDKNRTEGAKHQVKGSVKEAAGKLTDNESKELHGKIEKNAGKVQRNVGEAADEIRDARRPHH